MNAVERFKGNLRRTESGCLEWARKAHDKDGYGLVTFESHQWRAHRLAWTIANGPIPEGMLVCHHCDNPPCCELTHLFLGDESANRQDAIAKGRFGGFKRSEEYRAKQRAAWERRKVRAA